MAAVDQNGYDHLHNASDAATLTSSPRSSIFARGNSSGDVDEFPSIVPPTHSARTLVLCFDGTGDQYVCLPLKRS
jgi:hypothetical protein